MVEVLYAVERRFMRKTFEAIDRHVTASSAFVPLRPEVQGCSTAIRELPVDEPGDLDRQVREIDPAVVVYNSEFRLADLDFYRQYPLVHVRHGASIGRGGPGFTVRNFRGRAAAALAPGERWARRYREGFGDDTRVAVVGIPEADHLVGGEPPGEKLALYAPTNHNYGGGSYVRSAEAVLDAVADTDWELLFRPHPHDRTEEPGRSVTERCRERIADLPNVAFDDAATPLASMRRADLLVSDYSGVIAEWLHTGRPLVQLSDLDADREVPAIGHVTPVAELDVATLDRLSADGYPDRLRRRHEAFVSDLGIPMDGRAGERAAREVLACAA